MKDKVLVIAAHPDDEVLGLGGTIAKYVEKGIEVALLIVTDGSTSQYRNSPRLNAIIEEKKLAIKNSCNILGINKIYYGNLPDMKLDTISHIKINEIIENVIDEYKPTIIYTHFYGDVNKDHRCVFESTMVACRPVPNQVVSKIFLYSVPSSTEWNIQNKDFIFTPNYYEEISEDNAEKKYNAMNCYKEELREYPHPRSIKYLKEKDIFEGNKIGINKAESFMLVRSINR